MVSDKTLNEMLLFLNSEHCYADDEGRFSTDELSMWFLDNEENVLSVVEELKARRDLENEELAESLS